MKAIALISGGLDSILAAKVIQGQGVEVIPLHFKIPFCHKVKDSSRQSVLVKENLGLDLIKVDLEQEFLDVLKNPRYGFGSNMNPCIDCKILMLSKAKGLMQELGADFVVTGEVLGQRPMSQHKQALFLIPRRAGLEGLVVRPLCARVLAETIPEIKGWVRRDGLLNFNGRRRNPQVDLAKELQIKDYAWPSGGCLLTDPGFSRRLKELIEHKELNAREVGLLKFGRHFRLSPNTKLVVGRDEEEDNQLADLAQAGDYVFMPPETAGSTALGRGNFTQSLIKLSCSIIARYCDKPAGANVKISYRTAQDKEEKILEVFPLDDVELEKIRI
ncbi:MAG: tRNA 4-thiouridine(8) synthase ThiI [Candidatus Omnitrophica bacterium]|nr:tRNA 4-thiouridine(8) synthase ThiI [Candidatus Omnitrophota bacterium]